MHDKYNPIETTKAGTRYERLAAMVFRHIEKYGVVLHNRRLIRDTGVKHQIDVTINNNDNKRRVLVECKDFNLSGEKIGLPIIRDFWAVVDDIKPDDAIVLTCTGFTRDAILFAKMKGIRLAILRRFDEEDKENRIESINVNLHTILLHKSCSLKYYFPSQEDINNFKFQLMNAKIPVDNYCYSNAPIFLQINNETIQLGNFIDSIITQMNIYLYLKTEKNYSATKIYSDVEFQIEDLPQHKIHIDEIILEDIQTSHIPHPSLFTPKSEEKGVMTISHRIRITAKINLRGSAVKILNCDKIPINGLILNYDITLTKFNFEMYSRKIAELILQEFGDDDDLVICDEEISCLSIDPNSGEVLKRT
ncbi:restriction endonuclease [Methanothrix harundinacea]|nr:restriction endonuclease [Methanothrix harundinacea]